MAGRGGMNDYANTNTQEPQRDRKKLLIQAGIAAAVLLVLLVGLLLSGGKDAGEAPAPAADPFAQPAVIPTPAPLQPAPAATSPGEPVGPAQGLVVPQVVAPDAIALVDPQRIGSSAPPPAVQAPVQAVPPATPARPSATPPRAAVEAQPKSTSPSQAQPKPAKPAASAATAPPTKTAPPRQAAQKPASDRANASAAAAPTAPKTRVPTGGYRVVLGDFAEAAAVNRLRDKVKGSGYGIDTQYRVALGPYASRAQAESIQAELVVKGQPKGLVIADGAAFVVQMGVFGAAGNAQGLHGRLAGAGYPAQTQSRLVAGPFADRKSADAALSKLRRAGSVEGTVVALPGR